MIDWSILASLVGLPVQVILVVVVIWYSLELNKRHTHSLDQRDERFLKAMDKWSASLETTLDKLGTTYEKGMGRIADEVKQTAAHVAVTNALLTAHDAYSREAVLKIREKLVGVDNASV